MLRVVSMCDSPDPMPSGAGKLSVIPVSCEKCSQPENRPITRVRNSQAVCKQCFMAYCVHQFRAGFGKSRLIRDGESVVVGFSGGIGSCAMAWLIKQGLSESVHRKLRFRPIFVYIDFTDAVCQTPAQAASMSARRDAAMALLGHLVGTGAGQFGQILCLSALELEPRLREALEGAVDSTSREQLLNLALHRCLALAVSHSSPSPSPSPYRVLTGETGTRLAQLCLSSLASGRLNSDTAGAFAVPAFGVAESPSPSPSPLPEVTRVRPLRQLLYKEAALLCSLTRLHPACPAPWDPDSRWRLPGTAASVGAAVADCLEGLQVGFPSSVYNVLRTGEKLEPGPSGPRCRLCGLGIDDGESGRTCGRCYSCRMVAGADELGDL